MSFEVSHQNRIGELLGKTIASMNCQFEGDKLLQIIRTIKPLKVLEPVEIVWLSEILRMVLEKTSFTRKNLDHENDGGTQKELFQMI
jgi:hypothetical protein